MKRPDGSWDPFDDYVLDFALEQVAAGHRVALVTLVEIEGSSPRPLGAQMAVSERGDWVGYLSGGCIERAIADEAVAAMAEGRSRRVRYGRGSRYIDISLPCGSAIELVFDVDIRASDMLAVDAALKDRRAAALRVPLIEGEEEEEPAFFNRLYLPRRRLFVYGIGPVPVQLARLAVAAGFEVALRTPDEATAQAVRDAGIPAGPVGEARELAEADARSAIIFAFHDHDREERLLPAALRSEAFYVGAMGSRTAHEMRLDRLRRLGVAQHQLDRIRGPAGLIPRARSGSDIALSILAEIVEAARDGEVAAVAPEPALPHPAIGQRGRHEAPDQARLRTAGR